MLPMKPFYTALLWLLLLPSLNISAQTLRPGFDPTEYDDGLTMAFNQSDESARRHAIPPVTGYTRVYRSPVVGLANRWDLWLSQDGKVAAISIRGTVANTASWLANFYSAMSPATGRLQINDSTVFAYQLATSKEAAVHTGWLISLAHLAPSILDQIKARYAKGVKDYLLVGHSQGGAITYLLRSYLQYQIQQGALPKDITLKTYCSAAPKPGNTAYVYDFDFITRGGWAYTVVNAADWVPESPISIQQLTDMNQLNPFSDVNSMLGRQSFFVRVYAKNMFNKLRKSTAKSQKRYEKYLGDKVYKMVRKTLPQLKEPTYAHSMNYMRAGTPIVLIPDETYTREFAADADNKDNVWYHHSYHAYATLLKKWYGDKTHKSF
jgi:hypothetical protein